MTTLNFWANTRLEDDINYKLLLENTSKLQDSDFQKQLYKLINILETDQQTPLRTKSIICYHFSNIAAQPQEAIQTLESLTRALNKTNYINPLLTLAMGLVLTALIVGGVSFVGLCVGLTIGLVSTGWSGGWGAFPGAFLGALKGAILGLSLSQGFGLMVGISIPSLVLCAPITTLGVSGITATKRIDHMKPDLSVAIANFN